MFFQLFRYQIYPNGTIVIQKVRSTDSGFFRCSASNSGTYKITFAIRVEVLCKLKDGKLLIKILKIFKFCSCRRFDDLS